MDDPLLMGVLHGLTDGEEQLQALPRRQPVLVAEVCDRHALDQLHDEVRPAALGGAGVEHLGDVRVVHPGEGLALLLEAGDQAGGIEARPDQLEGDAPLHRLELVGDPDRGLAVFQKTCATCHRAEGRGQEVGPDLATLTDKSPEALLIAVLDPNREVDPRYLNYQLNTADGRTLTGIVTGDAPNAITLRRADGTEDTVRRADIESLRSTGLSLMPEGLEKAIPPQDMADLFAFLRDRVSGQK